MIIENNGFKYGRFILADGNTYTLTNDKRFEICSVKDVYNEDWKTGLVNGNPFIPKGTYVEIEDFVRNYYGEYFSVKYNGHLFYVKPRDFYYTRMII